VARQPTGRPMARKQSLLELSRHVYITDERKERKEKQITGKANAIEQIHESGGRRRPPRELPLTSKLRPATLNNAGAGACAHDNTRALRTTPLRLVWRQEA